MKKKLNFILILTILIFLYIVLLSFNYSQAISYNLSDSVFRLHIIANSDSSADQELKLKVRDKIIEYMNTLTSSSSDKKDVISMVNNHLDSFKEIALNTIKENGYNYDVNIEIGNSLKENINSESYEIISEGNNSNDNTSDIKIKFKIIEFLNNFSK